MFYLFVNGTRLTEKRAQICGKCQPTNDAREREIKKHRNKEKTLRL